MLSKSYLFLRYTTVWGKSRSVLIHAIILGVALLTMEVVADLHLHSKYSRAVSQDMVLPIMAQWAKKKGIDLLTTGDWTHPLWLREIRKELEEAADGIYKLKSQNSKVESEENEPLFLLTVEVSSIYSQGGKVRRIHNLIFSPNFEAAEKINQELLKRGVNLLSDGRPIMGISSRDLLELILGIDKRCLLICCHAWTPWFSLYGSNSGFDSIEECFGDYSKYIYGIETGLSSDPEMNWRIPELENRSILSFSDAHSPAKMSREATVFELEDVTYENVRKAIMMSSITGTTGTTSTTGSKARDTRGTFDTRGTSRILYTVEFYPEEGKYHYTGHRNCNVVQSPQETLEKGEICPVCKRRLTVGVEHRVDELAKEERGRAKLKANSLGIKWHLDPKRIHPPFIKLVPLIEIIAESVGVATTSIKVKEMFNDMCVAFGTELQILLKTQVADIEKAFGPRIAEGIDKVRKGTIVVCPGYDGVFGTVKIWQEGKDVAKDDDAAVPAKKKKEQLGLF